MCNKSKIFEIGYWSKSVEITRGVRQGCSLSPLIFNMVLEPQAIVIRTTKNLGGIKSGSTTSTIGLYADDIVCYLSHPESSMKALKNIIQEFGLISVYKVNSQKSILCGFYLTENIKSKVQDIWPGQWQTENIRYLGIKICITDDKMISILRIANIKMALLPKLIFLF